MRLAWAGVVAGATTLVACSLLVTTEDAPYWCAVDADGVDPCPAPLACIRRVCLRPAARPDAGPPVDGCVPRREICGDGVDNDCNGLKDDSYDDDRDGVDLCGGDCDDSDELISPRATERCNGLDDDCDGMLDEGENLCGEPQKCLDGTCRVTTCVEDGCDPGSYCDLDAPGGPACMRGGCPDQFACGAGERCSLFLRDCVVIRPLGDVCRTDYECASGVCAPAAAVFASAPTGLRRCFQACCPGTCTDGVCLSVGKGARGCIPSDLVVQPGLPDRAPCAADGECASGLCQDRRAPDAGTTDPDGGTGEFDAGVEDAAVEAPELVRPNTCLVGCTSNAVCQPDLLCIHEPGATEGRFGCSAAIGASAAFAACRTDDECAHGMCHGTGEERSCALPCATTTDCESGASGVPSYCGVPQSTPYVPSCVAIRAGHPGTLVTGDSCSSDYDCQDRLCIAGRCAGTCCVDASCGPGFRCRPVTIGDHFRMACLPRAVGT